MTEFIEYITHNRQRVGSIRAVWGGGYLVIINADGVSSQHELPTLDLARHYAETVKREYPDPTPSPERCMICDAPLREGESGVCQDCTWPDDINTCEVCGCLTRERICGPCLRGLAAVADLDDAAHFSHAHTP